jgi:hypothetical protein
MLEPKDHSQIVDFSGGMSYVEQLEIALSSWQVQIRYDLDRRKPKADNGKIVIQALSPIEFQPWLS